MSDLNDIENFLDGYNFGRYMEQDCQPIDYDNWEGFPTQICSYRLTHGTGYAKGRVVMLNPNMHMLAKWFLTAASIANPNNLLGFAKRLAKHINSQSGAQFVIAGLVLEDMDGDGLREQFPFRDGVTVSVQGVDNWSEHVPTEDNIWAALYGQPYKAHTYSRIASTTRSQYGDYLRSIGRSRDVSGLKFLDAVREEYQNAWNSDENILINAWVYSNYG
ncbi:hypothetical protein [Lentilitoribacter sp. Alg239-R112]|uniref:hypothetical protein n=1 Tax=Lentilitoribacter sp. Alg239-R112 TaxID=2305987 RepID=UPI0013A6DF5B|nr:hypothetical protein [Lentilitoribacter sp. Alg239-R112]